MSMHLNPSSAKFMVVIYFFLLFFFKESFVLIVWLYGSEVLRVLILDYIIGCDYGLANNSVLQVLMCSTVSVTEMFLHRKLVTPFFLGNIRQNHRFLHSLHALNKKASELSSAKVTVAM